jgi:hypothetical protein
MPRRNRNANAPAISTDTLADQLAELHTDYTVASRLALLCIACRANPATTGDYCALCKGHITRSARRSTLRRR